MGLVRDQASATFNNFDYLDPIPAFTAASMTVLLYTGSDYANPLTLGEYTSDAGNAMAQNSSRQAVPNRCNMLPSAG